jgi:hypothetical protein
VVRVCAFLHKVLVGCVGRGWGVKGLVDCDSPWGESQSGMGIVWGGGSQGLIALPLLGGESQSGVGVECVCRVSGSTTLLCLCTCD